MGFGGYLGVLGHGKRLHQFQLNSNENMGGIEHDII